MIYVSFTLGTNRTKGYAFVALTVSLFRLYTTSQELFDSIPGTVIILFIGVVLLGLSYKLETIKRVVSGASTKTEKEPQL
jgi:di/tricarboxylate transporter